MASFRREGTFKDRARFLEALRAKLAKLRSGPLQGTTETWETVGEADVARVAGFGARIEFTVAPSAWSCQAETPAWLPISPSALEEKFDREFADLGGL